MYIKCKDDRCNCNTVEKTEFTQIAMNILNSERVSYTCDDVVDVTGDYYVHLQNNMGNTDIKNIIHYSRKSAFNDFLNRKRRSKLEKIKMTQLNVEHQKIQYEEQYYSHLTPNQIEEVLKYLHVYDEFDITDLDIIQLSTYNYNNNEISDKLKVHRNTVSSRTKRIKEVVKVSVEQ